MDNATAFKTLRLEPGAGRSDILTAYARLARRYPLAQFPERHTRLLEAKQTLLNPEAVFKNILFDSQVELAWLSEALTHRQATNVQEMPISQLLAELMRRPIKEYAESQINYRAMSPDKAIEQMLDELGPAGLERLLGEFDLE